MSLPNHKRFREIVEKFSDLEPILVVGDIGIDKYTFGKVDRISPEAPVPVVAVTREWDKLGLAANVSDNLIGLGVKNYLCGVVGEDHHAHTLFDLMKAEGLSEDTVVRTKRRTTFKERIVTNVQQICRVDYESKQGLSPEESERILEVFGRYLPLVSAVIIEDYGKGMLDEKLCQDMIQTARREKKLVVVDPSRRTNPYFFKGANLLKPNQVETKVLCEKLGYTGDDVETMAKTLIDKLELEMVIITLGPQGMGIMSRQDNQWSVIPTVAKEVYDVSGAGDTAISVITASLLAGANLVEASWVGNCASGVVVGKKGTARVSIDELLNFYHKLEHLF